jgi:serine phosphatase RsbU (regulator of sigma subunit)
MSVRKCVLAISSDASVNEQVVESLESSGLEVITTPSATEAVSLIKERSPLLVFLSLFSEGLDPEKLIRQLRRADRELPVVLMADEGTAANVVSMIDQGASDYLVFPVPHASLIEHAVNRNVKQRRGTGRQRELRKLNRTLVESLRVLEQDQQAGFRIQQGMMPVTPFSVENVTLRHLIVPSVILSGDFIDYFELPNGKLLFYIADVSGHGASAAIVTVLLKSLSNRLCTEFYELHLDDAGEILGWFNRELLAFSLDHHATMFLAMVDQANNELQYANAAHFPGTILRSGDTTRFLEIGGLPLGIYETAEYSCKTVDLPSSYTLVMFSDGVFEIMAEKSLKDKEEHLLSLVECDGGDIESLADDLGLGEVSEFPDDIAVFTVARTG